MKFRARVLRTDQNAVMTRELEAESREAAMALLRAPSSVVLDLRTGNQPRLTRRVRFDVSTWCRELRLLMAAGMTVVEALETVQAQHHAGEGAESATSAVLAGLKQGQSLSVSMEGSRAFPPMLVASVKAGERTGALIETLDDYLRFDDQLRQLQSKLLNATIYPAIVVTVGGVVCLFLILFVMPKFAALYAGMPGASGTVTSAVIHVSSVLSKHQPWIPVGLAALAAIVAMSWRLGWLRALLSWFVRNETITANIVRQLHLARLYHSLAVMVRGGHTVDGALTQAAKLNLGLPANGLLLASDTLRVGKPVSVAMTDAGLTDAVTRRLLAVGERSGRFERVLQAIAQRHAHAFELALQRLSRLIEPVLLLFVALAVGMVVIAMYMPLFDIAGGIR